MEVRIGITHSPRELSFETEASADEVRSIFEKAAADGAPLVKLADTKGKQYLVDTASIAFVEIGSDASRKVGFVS